MEDEPAHKKYLLSPLDISNILEGLVDVEILEARLIDAGYDPYIQDNPALSNISDSVVTNTTHIKNQTVVYGTKPVAPTGGVYTRMGVLLDSVKLEGNDYNEIINLLEKLGSDEVEAVTTDLGQESERLIPGLDSMPSNMSPSQARRLLTEQIVRNENWPTVFAYLKKKSAESVESITR